VSNLIAEGLYQLNRFEESEKVLRSALNDQNGIIEGDGSTSYSQAILSDNYLFSSQYLQCKSLNEVEKLAITNNVILLSMISKGIVDLPAIEPILKQYPRFSPAWKCVLHSFLRKGQFEEITTLVKSYAQKVK
jgi:hypothetical protein